MTGEDCRLTGGARSVGARTEPGGTTRGPVALSVHIGAAVAASCCADRSHERPRASTSVHDAQRARSGSLRANTGEPTPLVVPSERHAEPARCSGPLGPHAPYRCTPHALRHCSPHALRHCSPCTSRHCTAPTTPPCTPGPPLRSSPHVLQHCERHAQQRRGDRRGRPASVVEPSCRPAGRHAVFGSPQISTATMGSVVGCSEPPRGSTVTASVAPAPASTSADVAPSSGRMSPSELISSPSMTQSW